MSVQSFNMLRRLTGRDGETIEDILQRVVEELRGLKEEATVELRVIRKTGARSIYSVRLTQAGAVLQTERATDPKLVVITNARTFHGMADESISPEQAYLDGKLKFQGNSALARRIIRQLGGSGEEIVCPDVVVTCHLINESYDPAGPDGGSVTVTGSNFTPGGHVAIVYTWGGGDNWGGGQIEASTTACSTGAFTYTAIGIQCGDIGVCVTATDNCSGSSTTEWYSTPC